jgi:GT2 family glycosyltransferase
MAGPPIVSVVIVNWNGAHHLRVCLPSLLKQSHQPLDIIVVDNGSSDDSAAVTREFHARWLPLAENAGLAPALNQGAAIAEGQFLLFVNNDMRFDPGFVAALLEPFSSDNRIFATDGMQYYWEGSEPAHLAARLTKHPPRGHASVELVPGLFFYQQAVSEAETVFMASAACMLVRKSVFLEIGEFDRRLPMGYEDAEICWRAVTLGWKVVYVPKAICWHRVGSSSSSPEGARFNFRGILRGRLLLATKLLPPRYALVTWIISTVGLLKDLGRLRWSYARDRIVVLFEFASLIPRFLSEKRALFRTAGLTPQEQLNRMLQLATDERAQSHLSTCRSDNQLGS